jgi:NAD(P)H-flavin reductase
MASYTLVSNQPSGQRLAHLRFQEPPESYVHPGQFIAVQAVDGVESSPAYFAIASSPGEPLELLVKGQPGLADALATLRPGQTVTASPAQGVGFQARSTLPRPLVCLVNGSALSAVRPVIREAMLDAREVHLLLGVLSEAHVPFGDEVLAWEAAGVLVHLVVDATAPASRHPRGFVQDHAAALGLIRNDVAVVLCGFPAMQADATARYLAAGLAPEFVRVNY